MHQLPRSTLYRNKIKPSQRTHARGQPQNAVRDGIAAAKIIKHPTVQPRGLQVFLYRLHVKTHETVRPPRHPLSPINRQINFVPPPTLRDSQAPGPAAPSLRALPPAS